MKSKLYKKILLFLFLVVVIYFNTIAQIESVVDTKAPAPIELTKGPIFIEGFNGTTFPPIGWQNIQLTGTGLWAGATSGTYPTCTPHSGAGMAYYNSFSFSSGASALLISPVIAFPAAVTKTVDFWMYQDPGYSTNYDSVGIYVNTTANLISARFLGNVLRYNATAGWNQFTYTIPASVTGNYYLIFKAYSAYGNNMFIDDVTVSTPAGPNDCGVTAIIAPITPITPGVVVPQVTVKNFGTAAQTNLPVKYKIGTSGTINTVTIASIAAGATTNVSFPSWTATNGYYNFIFYTDLVSDDTRENDTMKIRVYVSDNSWQNGASSPAMAYLGSSAACNGKVYCMGGNQTANAGTAVAIYDVNSNTWNSGPDLPDARVVGMGAATSTKVYMIGGSDGITYHNNIWELTPPGTTWIERTPLPNVLGWADAVSYQDSLIYIIGGNNGTVAQSTVYLYNNVNNTIRVCTPLPAPVFGGAAGITGNTLVYASGVNTAIQVTTYRGTINNTNRVLINWTTGLDMPATYFRTDGGTWGPMEIIVANGSGSTAWTPASPQPAYAYNPTTNVWRSLPNKNTPTLGAYLTTLFTTVINSKLVAISGYAGSACTNVTEILYECYSYIGLSSNDNAQFSIYPNPVSDILNIASDKIIQKVKIYNTNGQSIYQSDINNKTTEINTIYFIPGIYLLEILTNDGVTYNKISVAR